MVTAPCPRCARANAAHRTTCLYCGAVMPAPVAPPPPKVVPANIDSLVRDALRGGGVGKLRAALQAQGVEAPAPAPAPPAPSPTAVKPAPPSPSAPAPRAAPPAPEAAPAPAAPTRTRTETLDALVLAAERARVALDLAAALDAVAALVAEARAHTDAPGARPPASAPAPDSAPAPAASALLAEAPAPAVDAPPADPAAAPDDSPELPAPVELPPFRFAAMLVVGGTPAADTLVYGLGVDVVTARQLALLAGPRVAARSDDAAALEGRADRARAAGLAAGVYTRAALAALPPAETLLSVDPDGRWLTCAGPVWRHPPEPSTRPAGTPTPTDGVFLLVSGEVEVRDQRGARDPGRWARSRYTTAGPVAERRVLVVDVHLPDRIVRLVEGIVDLRGDTAPLDGSSRRALTAWLEAAAARWPDARLAPRRTCAAAAATRLAEDGSQSGSGWPLFEEYSRLARVHGA